MLAAAGLPVTVMAAPMIPALNDHELEAILIRARQAGATHASYILLRLPLELKDLFEEWLATLSRPESSACLSRLREMRGGELYKSGSANACAGSGQDAKLLAERFAIAGRQQGYSTEPTCSTRNNSAKRRASSDATAS